MKILVTITKKKQPPCSSICPSQKHRCLRRKNISVLLDGKMITNRYRTETEEVLKDLVKEGLSGEKLLDAFKQNT
ncbi:hypothetical protein BsIDN1_64180 [Bacillus safensis]|uniref:Uncharacterized protein n=1 Tax=Bacillus safensis TaxID=561879 RepID=A0A5S9MH54_BACIA|nr:hypothetical protein BsIDN1_64180 [Bacillus safensis]